MAEVFNYNKVGKKVTTNLHLMSKLNKQKNQL